MKTRYLTLLLTVAGAAGFAIGGCSTDTSNLVPSSAIAPPHAPRSANARQRAAAKQQVTSSLMRIQRVAP